VCRRAEVRSSRTGQLDGAAIDAFNVVASRLPGCASPTRNIIATRDERAPTAHDIAAETPDRGQLPDRVRSLLDRRGSAVHARRTAYRHWHEEPQDLLAERQRSIDQYLSRQQDQGLDYGLDL
jgi:hypothetical protein